MSGVKVNSPEVTTSEWWKRGWAIARIIIALLWGGVFVRALVFPEDCGRAELVVLLSITGIALAGVALGMIARFRRWLRDRSGRNGPFYGI